ncbi:hypothetical protein [Fluoribacter dumoffii]|uniref:Uncharacterized protein n=1 Tax=Fluoribacter dumoffii TaxID=463 RepID=A0A377G6R0_9GAMM|nr:hypothetical protein [Fluoribacter dumoffii]KTC89377.1 hypothetical protein Ldum_0445 [Fluoribacter dumoffii NY 23]STO20486.1 Uncharacterised protein [Fluoribacter dumoffii]
MAFEHNFILKCLDYMEHILTDVQELEEAIKGCTENKIKDPRYQLNSKITDSSHWSEPDKLRLSASAFEAIARASLFFYSEKDGRAHEIHCANTEFLERYLPAITVNTDPSDRINSVKKKIGQIKKELREKLGQGENPHAFFTPVTAGLVVLAAATTVALLSYRT